MKINILGVKINNITMDEAVETALSFNDKGHFIFTPNPEIIMMAQKDEELKTALNSADILLPDGIGVVIGAKLLGKPISGRVAGFDFTCNLFKSNKSFYFFGSKPGIAEKAAENLKKQYKNINIVGTHHGYFDDDTEIIKDINEKNPDILLVCLGAPKQEKWIYKNKDKLNVKLMLGVGGTLDVLSGEVERAPVIFQKLCLEWLYRGITDPKRLPRFIALPHFILKVIFGGRKYEG